MLKEIIYNYFDNIRKEKELKEIDINKKINFAPSYICDCKRKIYYKKTNTPASNPFDSHSYIKFALGDATHEKISNIIKKIGIQKSSEEWENIEYKGIAWIYRIDNIIEINNIDYVVEIKSTYMSGWNSIEKQAKEDHEWQLYLYMLFKNIKNGLIEYVGRDNGFMIEYNYTLDELNTKYEKQFLSKICDFYLLIENIEKKILPDRDFSIAIKNNNGILSEEFQKDNIKYKSDWHCNYCQWKNECWKDVYAKIKNNKFYINNDFIGIEKLPA
jgi:hypothetical protein